MLNLQYDLSKYNIARLEMAKHIITNYPGIKFTIEMPHVDNIVTENLTPDQLGKLVETLDEYKHLQAARMMQLVLFTGMLRGELFRLKWEDVDFNRKYITLRDPKGGRNRSIPISSQAEAIMRSIERTGSPYVFPKDYIQKNMTLFK